MPKPGKLTALAVEKVKAGAARIETPDGGSVGLYLVTQPGGAKSWAYRYRFAGKPKKLTLGAVAIGTITAADPPVLGGALSLAGARALADIARGAVAAGRDPSVEWRAQKAERKTAAVEEVVPRADSVEAVANQFMHEYVACLRKNTQQQYSRILRTIVVPAWGAKPIDSITSADVKALLATVKLEGRPVKVNRVFALVSSLFGWAGEMEITKTPSPCIGVRSRRGRGSAASPAAGRFYKEESRKRALSDDEVRLVWGAAEKLGWPWANFFKLLVLTGARRCEVAGITWDEFDYVAKAWNLPGERTKNGHAHTIPLPYQAMAIFESLPRVGNRYALTTTGRSPISGFAKAKKRVDAAIAELQQEEAIRAGRDPATVRSLEPWRIHDLRRTVASGLGALGVSGETIERALNHRSGVFGGLAGIYQRHRYETETRDALQRWANHVEQLWLLS